MSIDHNALVAIGKWFKDQDEAEDFLREHGLLALTPEQVAFEGGIDECLPAGMGGGNVDSFSGYGYWLGYRLRAVDPSTFRRDFDEAVDSWDAALEGGVEAEVLMEVLVS